MIILADTIPTWQSTVAVIAMISSGFGLLLSGGVVYFMWRQTGIMREQATKPAQPITPQPLKVSIDEELHDKFADKDEFNKHVASNTERHAQIFHNIQRAERNLREEMDRRFADLAEDRKQNLEKLNEQFTFIRENIAEIKTELKIRNE